MLFHKVLSALLAVMPSKNLVSISYFKHRADWKSGEIKRIDTASLDGSCQDARRSCTRFDRQAAHAARHGEALSFWCQFHTNGINPSKHSENFIAVLVNVLQTRVRNLLPYR
jgi:hypothetical protein